MPIFKIVTSDLHDTGHDPQRHHGIRGATEADAIAEARDRYSKTTGLDSADIAVEVLGRVEAIADLFPDPNPGQDATAADRASGPRIGDGQIRLGADEHPNT